MKKFTKAELEKMTSADSWEMGEVKYISSNGKYGVVLSSGKIYPKNTAIEITTDSKGNWSVSGTYKI